MRKSTILLQWFVVMMMGTSLLFAQNKLNVADSDPNAPTTGNGIENTTVTSIDESFESPTFPPAGWSTQSPDGGTGWERQTVGTSPIPGWNGGTVVAPVGGGQGVAFCTWTTGGASYNDQWLITPQVTISATDTLSFWVYKFSDLYIDNLDIKISTTGNATANFTTNLAQIAYLATDTGWFYYEYPLAAYAGQDIYIAFREHVTDNFNDGAAFFLDLVKVGVGGGTGPGSQMWDLQFVIDADSITGGSGLAGSEWDGTNFFAAEWGFGGGRTIFRISPAGALVDSFIPTWITGSSGIRDMAWDGTYLYGSDASTTIYCFTSTGTLISTITSPVAARAIAYDPVNDAFWVNNFSTDLTLVSRTGAVLNVISTPPSCYGMAYDMNSAGGPFLWLFTGTSSGLGCQVEQFNPTTGVATGVSHSVSGDLGATCIAGGLWSAGDIIPGEYTLGGLAQGEQDIFGYYLDMVVGTPEIEVNELSVNVFPVPASTELTVTSEEMITRVELINTLGQMVYASQVDDFRAVVDVRNIKSGAYFLRVVGESSETTRKVSVR
jgi:hypothetical protein